jgi:KDO2-lipid IV(A) lauroyltransferase
VAFLIDQNVQQSDDLALLRGSGPPQPWQRWPSRPDAPSCPTHPAASDGRYRLVYTPPIEWTPSGDREADIRHLTQKLTHLIESWVREAPEQWLWIHRRWKTQPPAGPAQ